MAARLAADRGARLTMRHAIRLLSVLLLTGAPAAAAAPASPFVPVMVDARTEAALGAFTFDRKHIAAAMKAARLAGAKGVVLKFFLDKPTDEASDAALAKELALIPSFLQARIDDTTKDPNPFPERFLVKDISGGFSGALGGSSGWLPLPRFAAAAKGVGFSDLADPARPANVPLIEVYKGRVSPTLYLSVLQWLLGPSKVVDGAHVAIGARKLTLDSGNEARVYLPPKGQLDYIPLLDLVKGRVPANRLKGKVVVLGYDGDKQTFFDTPTGKLGAHRLFCFALADLYRSLAPAKP